MLTTMRNLIFGRKDTELVNTPLIVTEEDLDTINQFYKESCIKLEDLSNIPDPVICGNLESNKTLLLVDDQEVVFYLYDSDFNTISLEHDYSVLTNYKIVKCGGKYAGFIASKYIESSGNEILIAILDLTLGLVIRTKNGPCIYDGVDIALELINKQPKCKIGMCTAHIPSETNPAIRELVIKFNKATGHHLLDHTFTKNSDRANYIYNMIKDVENGDYTDYRHVESDDE
jgi:hypothetical protein